MPTDFNEFEIEIECETCDAEWIVTGKQLTQCRDVPCPSCGEVVRLDIWGYHAEWKRVRKMQDGL